jgi:arylsulfatase A-like enzyme
MSASRRWRVGGPGLALLALLPACAAPPPEESGVDLLALLPEAERWTETAEIDLANSPEPALLGGWSAPSRDASDYLWSAGGESELEFRRADGRAFELHLRGWAHPRLPGGQSITVAVNGTPFGEVRLAPEPSAVTVAIPERGAYPGLNRLTLSGPDVVQTGTFRRPLGAAFDRVRFDAAPAPDTTQTAGDGAALHLAAGAGVDFFVEMRPGATLRLDGARAANGAGLGVDLECDGRPPRFGLVERAPRRSETVALPVDAEPPALCRLTLRATPSEARGRSGSVTIASVRLLPAAPPATPEPDAPSTAGGPPPSFLIYLVDALRADRVGGYGAGHTLTPGVDRFAASATLFANARAQTSWTRPAVATLFSGLTPLRHGAVSVEDRLPEEIATLAERLRQRGFRTAYFTANGNTAETFGFAQGFDTFHWLGTTDAVEDKVPTSAIHAQARGFLDTVDVGTPFLLVLHTVETHAPYRPAPPHRERWAPAADPAVGERGILVYLASGEGRPDQIRDVEALYEATVAEADEGFSTFLAELERRGRSDSTSVLFLSDHGEELFDHGGVEHGRTLFEEQLRIPFVWSVPGAPGGRRIDVPVDQVDVLPTVLELASLPADPALPGRSFAGALRGGAPPPAASSAAWLDRLNFHAESIVAGRYKLIRDRSPRSRFSVADELLFDLAADPAEAAPIGPGSGLRIRALRAGLRGWSARSGPALTAPPAVLDARLREELEALGYLH